MGVSLTAAWARRYSFRSASRAATSLARAAFVDAFGGG